MKYLLFVLFIFGALAYSADVRVFAREPVELRIFKMYREENRISKDSALLEIQFVNRTKELAIVPLLSHHHLSSSFDGSTALPLKVTYRWRDSANSEFSRTVLIYAKSLRLEPNGGFEPLFIPVELPALSGDYTVIFEFDNTPASALEATDSRLFYLKK